MRLTALVSGALFVTICLRAPGLNGEGPLLFVLLTVVALLPVTSALVRYSARGIWFIAPLVLIGVVVGMIDVVLDTKEDRNLFPIEMIVACVLVTPSVVIGTALGWFLKKKIA
jgi:heme/copper-type cytochrome/quinol oxidase subunit 4